MPRDAFTLKTLCDELNLIFSNGKINRIVQPDDDQVVFTVYTGKLTQKLIINVNPSSPRIGIIEKETDSLLTVPNFCMLLRKHLIGATIDKIQMVGYDRIVKIDITPLTEFFDSDKKVLYVELMGRYSNIILTENNKILGANRGINMFDNGVRPLIVGCEYVFPKNQDKALPCDDLLIEKYKTFNGEDFADFICKNVQGVALSTAKAIVERFIKTIGASDISSYLQTDDGAKKFFDFSNKILYSPDKNPCVLIKEETPEDVFVFPYPKCDGEIKYFDTLYQAEEYYFSNRLAKIKFNNKKEKLRSLVSAQLKKVQKKYNSIILKEKDAEKAEEYRIKGELILSNIYAIPKYEEKIELQNYYDDYKPLSIDLDKNLSPSRNAENYYKKYNKQKRTLVAILPQKEKAISDMNYLNNLLDEINLCDDLFELSKIQEELVEGGFIDEKKQVKKAKKETAEYRIYEIDGITVRVGRNNLENDRLTKNSPDNNIWVHAKDYHSSHLIIECSGKQVSERVIKISAEICAYYSRGRYSGKTSIVYTEKKNVKKPQKSPLGFWVYERASEIVVNSDAHKEFLKSN